MGSIARGGGSRMRRRGSAQRRPVAAAPMVAILLLLVLVAQAIAARESLGFLPAPAAGVCRSGGVGSRRRGGVVTASSVQEPPPPVPRFGSGEEDGDAPRRVAAVLSSLVKQGRLPMPGAPLPQQREERGPVAATPQPFSLETAVLAAPFAFEAYNDPPRSEGWWQLGADQNEVCITSPAFLQEAHGGMLNMRVLGLTETRPGTAPVLLGKKKKLSMLPPIPLPIGGSGAAAAAAAAAATGAEKEEAAGVVVEAAVTMELGDEYVGTQRLQLNRSITEGGRVTYKTVAPLPSVSGEQQQESGNGSGGAFAAFVKDPLQPRSASSSSSSSSSLLRLTLKGEDQRVLGSASLDLAEVMQGPPTAQSEAAGTWRVELSLSQPTPPASAPAPAAPAGAGDSGSEARQRLADAALGLKVAVDLQYTRLDRSNPVVHRPVGKAEAQQGEEGEGEEEWKGATGCSRDWRELARALGGDAVAGADMELLCFLENKGTDAQVKLWRDARRKRLLVAFRGTEWWKVRDIIVDLKLLQEPWDVRALHQRGKESAAGGASSYLSSSSTGGVAVQVPAEAAAAVTGGSGEVEQQGEGGPSSSVVDIYTALAAQANRTMLLYNELDQYMKGAPGWIGGYVEQVLRVFSSSTSTSSSSSSSFFFEALPPSLLLGEAAAVGRHHHQLQEQEDAAAATPPPASSASRAPPPVALTAPGLGPWEDATEPKALSPVRPSPTAYPSASTWSTAAPAGGDGAAVADVFIAALDKVVTTAGAGVTSFVQPLTGRVRRVADFQQAFADVARALGLASQVAAASSASASTTAAGSISAASAETEEEEETAVLLAAAGAGDDVENSSSLSPLVLLPSRFRTVFASLVEEALRRMDATDGGGRSLMSPSPSPAAPTTTTTTKPAAPFASSLLPQADFSARLYQALDQVVLPGLQRKQLQRGLTHHAATVAGAASASDTDQQQQAMLPPLDAKAFGNSDDARVHAGFKEAYLSVRPRLLALVQSAAGHRVEEDGWEVLCTGHSMGGALASLHAHDLSVLFPRNRVRMYSFGSPRLGNSAFAQEYGRANGDSYRIVNEWDVIARFPRGLSGGSNGNNASSFPVFQYDHAGRTALLNNHTLWVEGEQEGPCPLRDVQPLRPTAAAAAAMATTAVASSVELEPLFLEAEWQLLNALLNGAGFTSHLEYRYLEALGAAQRQQQRVRDGVEAAAEASGGRRYQPSKAKREEAGSVMDAAAVSVGAAARQQQPSPPQQPPSTSSSGIGSWFRVPPITPMDIVAAATMGGGGGSNSSGSK